MSRKSDIEKSLSKLRKKIRFIIINDFYIRSFITRLTAEYDPPVVRAVTHSYVYITFSSKKRDNPFLSISIKSIKKVDPWIENDYNKIRRDLVSIITTSLVDSKGLREVINDVLKNNLSAQTEKRPTFIKLSDLLKKRNPKQLPAGTKPYESQKSPLSRMPYTNSHDHHLDPSKTKKVKPKKPREIGDYQIDGENLTISEIKFMKFLAKEFNLKEWLEKNNLIDPKVILLDPSEKIETGNHSNKRTEGPLKEEFKST